MRPGKSPFTNHAKLKEVPHVLDGSFAWLARTPTHKEWAIGDECSRELPKQLKSVTASAAKYGLQLPQEFITFIKKPALHKHVRSTTGCYLSVARSVLPFAEGHLIRFLSDQQGCAHWYLYANADGSDHCVVMSLEYFDFDEMDYDPEEIEESDFQFCGESFEAFVSRYWLENEIWFAEEEETPPPDVPEKFLKLYAQS